jgi:hypothetical protein
MSFTATVENDTIKLPPGVHLPDGTEVTVMPVEAAKPGSSGSALAWMENFLGAIKTLPPEFAEDHTDLIRARKLRPE